MTENGHTSGNERETFMEFVNFDGTITGDTARELVRQAKRQGVKPQDLLASFLRYALAEATDGTTNTDNDVKVEPMTINAGNGGFHVVTVVADGYGYLVAENSAGEERARVKVETEDDEPTDPAADLKRLMDAFDASEANPQS